jgi:hypothetical protein
MKQVVAINIGASLGILGALFLLPSTAVGLPLLFSIVGFWGLVNVITLPRILRKDSQRKRRTEVRVGVILMWIFFILGIVLISSARR